MSQAVSQSDSDKEDEKPLTQRDRDRVLSNLIKEKAYPSLRVVGRGTVRADAREVRRSPEFQQALEDAKQIVLEKDD